MRISENRVRVLVADTAIVAALPGERISTEVTAGYGCDGFSGLAKFQSFKSHSDGAETLKL
jgi:hypothetical protein